VIVARNAGSFAMLALQQEFTSIKPQAEAGDCVKKSDRTL
jgi:hypothetical protein